MNGPQFIRARHGYFDGSNRPRWIVVHTMEYPKTLDAARWCANYFATDVRKSAHYCIDAGTTIQSIQETDGAWHTPGFAAGLEVNRNSIGIEHAGYANQSPEAWSDSYNAAMLDRSADLVADIANRHGIPVRRLSIDEIRAGTPGIAGHHDFTIATGVGSHTDPGFAFPWDSYLHRVNERGRSAISASRPRVSSLALVGLLLATAGAWALLYPNDARALATRLRSTW